MDSLLEEYRNPTINSETNQALLKNYTQTLDEESKKALENSIISPLASRNMLRSSSATNLYSDLSKILLIISLTIQLNYWQTARRIPVI